MSIARWRTRALSHGPRVIVSDTWLVARTNRLWTALSFGSHHRVLRVDAQRQQIWLHERRWWRATIRELAFDEVDHLAYRYDPFVTELFTTVSDGHMTFARGDQLERYTLGLVLRNGEVLPLFSFVGDGAVMTGGLGVLLGDEWLDMEGTQEEDSRELVRNLVRLTGLGLGPRSMRQAAERVGRPCPTCKQLNRPRVKCLYCGAALESPGGSEIAPPVPSNRSR